MEEPPQIPPLPEGYSPYYRHQFSYGSADRLQALSDGYFGLSLVFAMNVGLVVVINVLRYTTGSPQDPSGLGINLIVLLGLIALMGLVVGFFSFPYNKKIAFAKGWPVGNAVLASVLMGLNSALCCGIVGIAIMQQIAVSEMKNYGLGTGLFGVNKGQVKAVIDQMRQAESQMPPNYQNPPG